MRLYVVCELLFKVQTLYTGSDFNETDYQSRKFVRFLNNDLAHT